MIKRETLELFNAISTACVCVRACVCASLLKEGVLPFVVRVFIHLCEIVPMGRICRPVTISEIREFTLETTFC